MRKLRLPSRGIKADLFVHQQAPIFLSSKLLLCIFVEGKSSNPNRPSHNTYMSMGWCAYEYSKADVYKYAFFLFGFALHDMSHNISQIHIYIYKNITYNKHSHNWFVCALLQRSHKTAALCARIRFKHIVYINISRFISPRRRWGKRSLLEEWWCVLVWPACRRMYVTNLSGLNSRWFRRDMRRPQQSACNNI